MSDLILPSGFKKKRDIDFSRFRGYVRHKPCNGEAFWFTCFGKSFLDMDWSEVWFENGQLKQKGRMVEDYKCPHCRRNLEGKDLLMVRIQSEKDAARLHALEHNKKRVGELCEFCGERRKSVALETRN